VTFLAVLEPVLAKCANDSARRALLVRLLAVLGHEAPPEVWRLKWAGRVQIAYSWSGSPAGDLWLVGGHLHVGLVVVGDALAAAPEELPRAREEVEEVEDIWAGLSPSTMVQVHAAYRLIEHRLQNPPPAIDLDRLPSPRREDVAILMEDALRLLSRRAA
jgi:hypothetical protein